MKENMGRFRTLIRDLVREFLTPTIRGSRRMETPNTVSYDGHALRPLAGSGILQQIEQDRHPTRPKAACVLIQRDDGLFLGVSRKYDTSQFGLPGGKVDPGETPEQAAVRELWEESGLKLVDPVLLYDDSDGEYHTFTFTGKVSGDLRKVATGPLGPEGVVDWVDRDTILSGPFAWYNKKLFAKLGI
jgi:8-oxo-dGTP pyrophosphatase MutT (NUDIX family)